MYKLGILREETAFENLSPMTFNPQNGPVPL